MSTKRLEECLRWVENYLGSEPEAQEARRAARSELEAIRKAAKLYMQSWKTADEARALLKSIAEE